MIKCIFLIYCIDEGEKKLIEVIKRSEGITIKSKLK